MKSKNALLKFLIWELKNERKKKEDIIPNGYFTTKEIAKEMGRSGWTARCYVRKAMDEGKVEKKLFKKHNSIGNLILIPYYKINKK